MNVPPIRYIPVGCIGISGDETDIKDDIWTLQSQHNWLSFQVPGGLSSEELINPDTCLDPSLGASLLKSPKLCPYGRLFRARWMQLEFRISSTDQQIGLVRVYLLPDDILRRSVERSDFGLKKARIALLRHLDYSKSSWFGKQIPLETGEPVLFDPSAIETDEDTSLLRLFNTIPSPNPDPVSIADPYSQDAMQNLLKSEVGGLSTVLHHYQRRSAAMMLQKEVQPGLTLDPRLLYLKDPEGSPWYMDPVSGAVLAEPRYYDEVTGGILAEEMGSGKTIICLALILATRHLPTPAPEIFEAGDAPVRKKVTSLADMAASCATRNAVAWKPYFELYQEQLGYEYSRCAEVLLRNPGYYLLPAPEPRRCRRNRNYHSEPPRRVYLSSASIVIVPNNLVAQWKQEICKHTDGLKYLVFTKSEDIPPVEVLLEYDLLLFSQSRFEMVERQDGGVGQSVLSDIHFKRCIVDEGHKLGNSKMSNRSNLLMGLESLNLSSRWVVTGTPSHGLYGVDVSKSSDEDTKNSSTPKSKPTNTVDESSDNMEKKDLERIGAMTALYLKARPWANTTTDTEDSLADWTTYLMLPKHNSRSQGRWDCLRSTLSSLIIRHQLTQVGELLPSVDEKVVILDGSYQDQLSLNIFCMMIVFNTVQSQRTDVDYFFHQKQRRSLMQIVHNLKQSSFFGGSFFTSDEISKAIETAEEFLRERKVEISPEDEAILTDAIRFGHVAIKDKLRSLSNQFHEMPVLVTDFPGGAGQSWSLDGEPGDLVCTSASMLLALQKLVSGAVRQPEGLNSLLNGGFVTEGMAEKLKILEAQAPSKEPAPDKKAQNLAGNTKLGNDAPKKSRSHGAKGIQAEQYLPVESFSGPLEQTKITSTVSAKLSYLIDSLVKYQEHEKIIVFYENENVAWYLASMLDVVSLVFIYLANVLHNNKFPLTCNSFKSST